MWAETIPAAARRFADRAALVAEEGWTISFTQLDRLTDEVAVGLARRGVRQGEVVALLVPSSVDYIVLYGALAKLGAITAGVSSRLAAPERTRLVNDVAGADRAIATAALADDMAIDIDVIDITLADGPGSVAQGLRAPDEAPPPLAPDGDRPVTVVFTSGTTGVPKGAMFTNRILADIAVVDTGNGWGEGGPITSNTQMAHIGVMGKVPAQFAAGTTLHVIDRWSATAVLDAVARYRMPAVGGVAPQIALMLRHPEFDRYDFSAVKLIVTGGAPSPPDIIEEARRRFDAHWTQRYACTEGGGVGTFTWIDAPMEEMLATVGRPRPGIELQIRDPDGDQPVAPGTVGEVCLRSPAVMAEYWRDPVATAAALRGGWLHTGDQGWLDDTGCLRLVGRRGEGYHQGGEVVFPVETERVLAWHPKVDRVCVVPRPHEVLGAVGVAVVIPADPQHPPSLEELTEFGRRHLADFKLPRFLRLTDAFPMTPMSKIDRVALERDEADPTG
ncbi:class I adenylate-forming enzyme family protein [Candidatus Poriferisocius sp.]|uniref:class I adenylate-forming enzyme family protein n=1 Tax=Candidatus Poriferisocius sp. TaxID=3101276 RepID=UPI003B5C2467